MDPIDRDPFSAEDEAEEELERSNSGRRKEIEPTGITRRDTAGICRLTTVQDSDSRGNASRGETERIATYTLQRQTVGSRGISTVSRGYQQHRVGKLYTPEFDAEYLLRECDDAIFFPAVVEVAEHFHIGEETASLGIPLYVPGFAPGPTIWAPLSQLSGRRLPLIIGLLGYSIFTIGTKRMIIILSLSGDFRLCLFGLIGFIPAIHWIAPTCSGIFNGFGILCIFLQCSNYLIDSYLSFAASVFAANEIIRSAISPASPPLIRQMFDGQGIQCAGTLLGCVVAVIVPIPIAFSVWGPKLREKKKFGEPTHRKVENGEKIDTESP